MPPDSTTGDLDDLYHASRNLKRRFEPQAFLNMAYVVGDQWLRFDGRQLFRPELEDWRAMLVDNRVLPIMRKEIARMTKNRPVFVGVPRTQGDQDVSAARYGEVLLEYLWKELDLTRKHRAALGWSRTAMAGFWKIWWDKTAGDTIPCCVYTDDHPLAGQAVKDGYGRPIHPDQLANMPPEATSMIKATTVAMGEICVEVKTFFEVFPDPLAREEGLESAEWAIEEGVYSKDYIAQHFPGYEDVLSADSSPSPGIAESRLPNSGFYSTDGATGYNGYRLREYWHKPSALYPRGKHVVWAQGQILVSEDNPYPWLPYVMFRGIPVPGRFWPDCIVTQLISGQTQLNKTISQIAENAERIGNPPFLKPASMGDEFEWRGLPGEEVTYQDNGSPNAQPRFMEVPELPQYVQQLKPMIEESLMEISGQHDVTSAQVPTGVTAASAISMLQEADDTMIGPDIEDDELTMRDAGRRLLWLAENHYTDERHIRISGDDGQWDVYAFKGELLTGCADIEVQAGSGLPQSKAMKQAAIMQVLNLFVQNGVAVSERALRKVLGEFQVAGLEAFFADQEVDTRQINEENRKLLLGMELEINSYDNDVAHIEGHENCQKTARYQMVVAQNPAVGLQYEQHVQAHRERVESMAAQQSGGAPPGVGPSGPPALPSGRPQQPQLEGAVNG